MGKICPQCGYHEQENSPFLPLPQGCQHDFAIEPANQCSSNAVTIKWRCRKCLEVKYTND